MAQKKSPPAADEHAISFFGFAEQYQKAANLLYDSDKTLRIPTYFLYMHAIELALKAFLRAHDVPIAADRTRKHHLITTCMRNAANLGSELVPMIALISEM